MDPMERPSRRGASKDAKAEAATAGLKNLREKGGKRIDDTDIEANEDNIYDVVRATWLRLVRFSVSRALPRADEQHSLQNDLRHAPLPPRLTSNRSLHHAVRIAQVTEEEYAALVYKRREEYGGFVVGEEGDECVQPRPRPIPIRE